MNTEQQNGWIKWDGGECPFTRPGTAFEVEFSDGSTRRYSAKSDGPMDCCWLHDSHQGRSDIIAYRLVEQSK